MKNLTPKKLVFVPLCLALLFLTACSMSQRPLGSPENPYPFAVKPQIGEIFHPATGTMVSQNTMLDIAGESRIIYVGETHDNPAAHRLQVDVLKAIAARYPGRTSIGMEMFTPEQQPILDRWSAGELDEKTFLREVKWYSVWQGDFDLYRDLLIFSRDNHIPVIGLNSDKKMKQLILHKPIAEMTEEERAKMPDVDLTDPYHSAMVKAIYGDHVKSAGRLAGFQRVQALWDETMADSIATYLLSPQGESQHMVVIAGGNHVRYGFGIPRRVFRRLPVSYSLLGSKEIEIPESRKKQLMNVNMPEFPMLPYDFITFTRYEDTPKKVKLGVGYKENEEGTGLTVTAVVPESAAALAGLKKDDILLELDGEPLTGSFDLIYPLSQKKAGETITLKYDRGGELFTTEATLKPLADHGP
jgi:uncharacterized iron-regulated protein